MTINHHDDHVRHSDTPRDLEYFQNKFDCRIEDSEKFRQYVRRMPYHIWDGKIPFDVETQVVPMKAIHLTTDNLARLVSEQEHMDRLQQDAEQGKKLWRQERADQAVRESNPAVEKAYRNYQMLLELAR